MLCSGLTNDLFAALDASRVPELRGGGGARGRAGGARGRAGLEAPKAGLEAPKAGPQVVEDVEDACGDADDV